MTSSTSAQPSATTAKRVIPTRNWLGVAGRWAFVAPVLILNLVVVVIPSIIGLAVAFTDWSGIGTAHFIGLDNFTKLFSDDTFFRALKNNLIWTGLFLTIPVSLGLLGAYMLAGIKRGQMIFRVIYFIPYVMASVVNAQVWRFLLHHRVGIGPWLAKNGITDILDFAVFGTKSTALYAVAFVDNWHFWGFLLVLYLAAMSAVDPVLYEVARLDGATRFQQFRYVTLPSIRPTLVFTLLMILIWSGTIFDYVYILTQGKPAHASEVMGTYLYNQAFARFDAGYGAAIGVVMTLWVAFAVGGFVTLRRRGWEI
jgi:raffinose/stachyose/melibiose transport system permease protein